jgi:ribonucleoside-diphosphate reductase alpha chain/ribonucleoside-triphosphate reductase
MSLKPLNFLWNTFLDKYPDNPKWNSILGQFVYLRTYSRFDANKGRREHWKETCRRVVEYSMGLYKGPATFNELQVEAQNLFEEMFNLRLFTAGRTMWIGGTEAANKFPLSNFNCSFTVVDSLEAFVDAFYLMMLGTGVGFRILPEDVAQLPKINSRVVVAHKPYHPKEKKEDRIEQTQVYRESDSVYIVVGDSKEGWVDALRIYFDALTSQEPVESIMINYDSVRPQGELLKTFGGRASGHTALRTMFKQIHKVVCRGGSAMDTVQAMDIMNIIGSCVVVGGVRRSSEITLFSIDDKAVMDAKVDLWTDPTKSELTYRSMSNNSVYFTKKPTAEQLREIFNRVINNGEPGFINAQAASVRRPYYAGTNPCAEILLADNGVCNLSEINVAAYVIDVNGLKVLDMYKFSQAIKLATRVGLRMTNVTLELPHWDEVQKRDRLTGVSFTGYVEAMDALDVDTTNENSIVPILHASHLDGGKYEDIKLKYFLDLAREVANQEAEVYASEMRIPTPLLVTTVKPSGTIAQLPTVSSGAHASYAPYYIRRVRISSFDPLAKTMLAVGYPVYPEANTMRPEEFRKLSNFERMQVLDKAQTWVIEFPIQTSAKKSANEETAVAQLNRYLALQKYWTDHNTSITITFNPDEVDGLIKAILENWDDYIGVSFLPKYTGAYPLMPYEEIDRAEYEIRKSDIEHISWEMITTELLRRESVQTEEDEFDPDCVGGACPVR